MLDPVIAEAKLKDTRRLEELVTNDRAKALAAGPAAPAWGATPPRFPSPRKGGRRLGSPGVRATRNAATKQPT